MSEVRAAGGVIVRAGPGGASVVLVHRPAYDDWTLPKGKLEPGEDEAAAALREVREETGLDAVLERDLGTIAYRDAAGRPKVVRYWRMRVPIDSVPRAAGEVDEAVWVPLAEARGRLSYERDREVLDRLSDPPPRTTPVVVQVLRHVKAGNRDRWEGPDEQRPASPAGRRQAERLVAAFDGQPLARLVSSPAVRCRQSLEPLAAARGLPVEIAAELAEGGSAAGAEELVLAVAEAGPSVLSTHGDVQQLLIERLLRAGVELRGTEVAFAKGSRWALEVVDGRVRSARYLPPPERTARESERTGEGAEASARRRGGGRGRWR
ncbi:MAG: ADP-ribose pyrophosphatase [Actinomycetota bacterium]|nr:MAG: ADP-ribose pyrophosphatase [Actinomycetota bacterium]